MQGHSHIMNHPLRATWYETLTAKLMDFDHKHREAINAIGTVGCFFIIGACMATLGLGAALGGL